MRAGVLSAVPGARAAARALTRAASRRDASRIEPADGAHPAYAQYAQALRDLHAPLAAPDAAAIEAIEALRGRIAASDEPVEMIDFGAGSTLTGAGDAPVRRSAPTTVGELTRSTSKPARWARFLFHVVHRTGARQGLELGTSMGISAAYEAAAFAGNAGRLLTIEGSPASAALAERHLRELGRLPDVVTIRVGRFDEALPPVLAELTDIDYVFIDGHHDEQATKDYFAQVKPHLAPGATVVFDDIRWTPGMLRAWEAVSADPDVAVAFDCGGVGLVCVAPGHTGRATARVRVG
ncbi:MAG: O-methyltransferase [Solirubrobacteraceae bacterium]